MGDLAMAANKVIGLTGTLLNGFADGLFYLLYRTMPEVMRAEGFDYYDEAVFQRTYGVVKKTNTFAPTRDGRAGEKVGSGGEKRLPGVSPLVFTKFLLENAVFVSISDMAEGLPEYTEFPLGVDMDADLKVGYDKLEQDFKDILGSRQEGSGKMMGPMVQALSTYPDMPYDCEVIVHPDTGEAMIYPDDLGKGIRNKERAFLELVQRKIEAGEKVLVYYQWTNKTDVAEKFMKLLRDNGIKVANLTSRIKAKERETWIKDQLADGLDVLLCNPELVKTGLTLLDFTTIVFYQMGYNIFTMRQASRRSWRLSQTKDIEVYFMYYNETIQEQAISLMASKLQASMALEGKFSEEGLRAMADNEDLLSKVASSVVEGIKYTVEAEAFTKKAVVGDSVIMREKTERERKELRDLLITQIIRAQLDYLEGKVPDKKYKETSTDKAIKNLFSNRTHISSLYRPYAV